MGVKTRKKKNNRASLKGGKPHRRALYNVFREKKRAILLLEDDRVLNKGIRIALEKDDHTIVSAFSFFEGVECYAKKQFDFYLI